MNDEAKPAMTEEARATRRWTYIWIAIGIVIVLVVIGFLIPISGSLRAIDTGLDRTVPPVKGVRSDVDPLPADIDRVNSALAQIRTQLHPLPGQAHAVIGNLGSIDTSLARGEGALSNTEGTLRHTNGELTSTSGMLASTSARLHDTESTLNATEGRLAVVAGTLITLSGTLGKTLTLAGTIEHTLVGAQRAGSQGTGAIWRRVQVLNGGRFGPGRQPNRRGLRQIGATAGQIASALGQVNAHLQSICESMPLRSLGQLEQGGTPISNPTAPAPARC